MPPSTNTVGLVDDEGNLFGVINVVDALVLLLFLAVVVAGTGLLLGIGEEPDAEPENGTTFVTLDFGTQPAYMITQLDTGDTVSPAADSRLTITDLYLAPEGDQIRVIARARLQGVSRDGVVNYNNAPPRLGRNLKFNTPQYDIAGQITDTGNGSQINSSTTTVVLRQDVSTERANAVSPGDTVVVAGHTAGTVADVAVYPTTDPDRRRLLVEADLSSYTRNGARRFGGTTLRTGQALTLPTDEYTIRGQIEGLDTTLANRALTNRTVVLELSSVPEETASAIRPGQVEQTGTAPTAYVTDATTTPTQIITTARDGSVVVNDHPTLRDVTLTTELRVSETSAGIEFRQQRLQYGSTVVLDLGPVTVETTVVDIGQ